MPRSKAWVKGGEFVGRGSRDSCPALLYGATAYINHEETCMQQTEASQKAELQPVKHGWTDKVAVISTDNPDTMLLRFVFFQQEDDKSTATPLQIAMNTRVLMELMKASQEMQRLLCLAVPEGTLSLVRGDEDWPPKG